MATTAVSSTTSSALASSAASVAASNKANAQKLITSLSAGSGVDVASLAKNLVDAERGPQENAINAKITKNESRISGYSALSFVLDGVKTAMSGLKDQNNFNSLVPDNSNPAAFSVTAGSAAVGANHEVSVLQLAKAQRTVSDGLPSATTPLNGGKAITFSLTVNGTSSDIKLPDGYDKPQDVVDFINVAKKGVTAKLVNTGDGSANPYQIVLSGDAGSAGAFSLTPKYSVGGVDSATAPMNAGAAMTVKLSVGGGTPQSIALAAGDDTPEKMIAAINNAGLGINASLVANAPGADYPFKIFVTGPSGAPSDFSLSANYDGQSDVVLVDPGLGFTASNPVNQTATDAKVKVDGITFTRSTNTLTDVVPGLTFTLKGTTSTPASLGLSRDTSAIKEKLNAMVVAYNDAVTIMGEVSNPKSEFEVYGATLVGDSTVRSLKQQLRQMIMGPSSTPGTAVGAMWQMGISVNEQGVMSMDETKLDTALANNYSDVVKTFTGNQNGLSIYSPAAGGIAGDSVRKLTKMLGADGILVTQSQSAEKQNSKHQIDLEKLGIRMDSLLARYQKQFASMDSMVGSVNSQKASLKSTFDGMMANLTGKSG